MNDTILQSRDLHKQFVELGRERNRLTYKLLALIPAIFQSGIYKKHTPTIYEYAGKFGGLSKEVVKKVLRNEKYLQNKPKLKEAVRKYGIHKVSMVATLATPETEEIWAERVEHMSKSALQVLVKEVREKEIHESGKQKSANQSQTFFPETTAGATILQESESSAKAKQSKRCMAAEEKIKVELSGELMFEFLKFKKQFEKAKKEKLSNTETMAEIFQALKREMLHGQDHKNQKRKNQNLKTSPQQKAKKQQKVIPGDVFLKEEKPANRYIPAKLKKTAITKTNQKCAYPNCNKPYSVIHHRERFAKSKNHSSIIPLCKEHHEFAHNSLIKNEQQQTKDWQLQPENNHLNYTDFWYQRFAARI